MKVRKAGLCGSHVQSLTTWKFRFWPLPDPGERGGAFGVEKSWRSSGLEHVEHGKERLTEKGLVCSAVQLWAANRANIWRKLSSIILVATEGRLRRQEFLRHNKDFHVSSIRGLSAHLPNEKFNHLKYSYKVTITSTIQYGRHRNLHSPPPQSRPQIQSHILLLILSRPE